MLPVWQPHEVVWTVLQLHLGVLEGAQETRLVVWTVLQPHPAVLEGAEQMQETCLIVWALQGQVLVLPAQEEVTLALAVV
ncbi:MAG: hypothetical protein C0514_05530 [Candidatus Puniceispirillum sp.]|nr:hypothetical protein [Candidatus Puniceispirillum sp.]